MKKWIATMLMLVMLLSVFTGCAPAATEPAAEAAAPTEAAATEAATEAPVQEVKLSFFTGKMETIDLLDEIIAAYNAQSNGITVEQEFQQDASNIIKIKFASDAVPDVMTTYEKEFVDQGKYLALGDMNQWWDRLIPSMKESCSDLTSGNQYRVCTNMTMAGFFYNKQMYADLGLTPATTWEGFVANLEAIKAAYPDVDPWFIFGEAWHLGHLVEFFPQGYIKAKYGATAAKQAFLGNDADILQWGYPNGGTDIYSPAIRALELLENVDTEAYFCAIVLLTDGESNSGAAYRDFERAYRALGKDIPVFSIMLGNAQKDQLEPMADLSLGAVFDSKGDLISAFKKVKSIPSSINPSLMWRLRRL